jgi:tetrapyrrole methylase family protein / MazG family protein
VLDALVAEARRRWGLDLATGLQVITAETLISTPLEASRPVLVVPAAALGVGTPSTIEPLAGRHGPGGADALRVLRRLYPPDHAVGIFRVDTDANAVADAGADAGARTIGTLEPTDLALPLYLPPVPPELASAGPWAMPYISARLRRPDGCPWDLEQTHESLRKHLLEESYEVYDALAGGATPDLAEELGDLLLQVILHAQLAAEAGIFDLADVQASIARKIVRRHPHVFGDAVAATAADVTRQWERIKAAERAAEPEHGGAAEDGAAAGDGAGPAKSTKAAKTGALDGISRSLPALAASQEMQERAAAIGYDWPDMAGVLDKVTEELAELTEAPDAVNRLEEFGDLLFVIVNVGRRLGIETEAALRAANDKFRGRFGRVERMVAERGVAMRDLDFATLDTYWDAAKAEERAR